MASNLSLGAAASDRQRPLTRSLQTRLRNTGTCPALCETSGVRCWHMHLIPPPTGLANSGRHLYRSVPLPDFIPELETRKRKACPVSKKEGKSQTRDKITLMVWNPPPQTAALIRPPRRLCRWDPGGGAVRLRALGTSALGRKAHR